MRCSYLDSLTPLRFCRTIPIYYGSRFVFGKGVMFCLANCYIKGLLTPLFVKLPFIIIQSEIFNPKAFIFFDLDVPQQALGQIQFLEQNPTEYEKMMNEPILAHGQDTIEKYFSWDETVGAGMLKSRIREMMGLG